MAKTMFHLQLHSCPKEVESSIKVSQDVLHFQPLLRTVNLQWPTNNVRRGDEVTARLKYKTKKIPN